MDDYYDLAWRQAYFHSSKNLITLTFKEQDEYGVRWIPVYINKEGKSYAWKYETTKYPLILTKEQLITKIKELERTSKLMRILFQGTPIRDLTELQMILDELE